MASVVESIVQPDEDAIKAHLETLFAPLREEYPGGVVELRYGQAKPDKSSYFNVRPEGLAEAARFAAGRNREGANVYVGVNPRKPGVSTKGSASDTDVEVSIWQFADIDKLESLKGLGTKLRPCPPTYTVDTGTKPHRRPHLYWLLDAPVWNMAAWKSAQSGIAGALGGDAVINPSRIMRLAGTVNFPPQHKLQRGYAVEATTIRTVFDDDVERGPYGSTEIVAAFPKLDGPSEFQGTPAPGQTTLQAMASRGVDVAACLANCRADHNWRDNARSLTAHWVLVGWSTVEILAMAEHITVAGYHVEDTRKDLLKLAKSAREKWNKAEPDPVAIADPDALPKVFETLSLDEIEALPPPTYLIEDLLPEHGQTYIYGDPGAGKSFIAIDASLRLAYGMDWHGRASKQTGVLYIAGEGRHGIGKRIKGWRREHGLEGVEAPFKLLPVAVHMLDKASVEMLKNTIRAVAAEVNFKIGLVVVDTVSRSIPGHDENKQDTMSLFADGMTDLHHFVDGASLGVHHSGKDSDKGMRGSSVLLGAADACIRVTKAGQIVTLKNEKQKDDEEAAPIYMDMKKVEWSQGLAKPISTIVPFTTDARPEVKEQISDEQIVKAFQVLGDAWMKGKPLSTSPQTRSQGRYAPSVLSKALRCPEKMVTEYLAAWLENECLSIEVYDPHSKKSGIRVIDPIVPGAR